MRSYPNIGTAWVCVSAFSNFAFDKVCSMFVHMADMKTQLANVAFGGSWSEEILDQSKLTDALEIIAHAAEDCVEQDVWTPALRDALQHIKQTIGKGPELAESFQVAVGQPNQSTRYRDAKRAEANIVRWCGFSDSQ
jgi:hypothetical protein